jgi:hypothetical protein
MPGFTDRKDGGDVVARVGTVLVEVIIVKIKISHHDPIHESGHFRRRPNGRAEEGGGFRARDPQGQAPPDLHGFGGISAQGAADRVNQAPLYGM